MKPAVLIPGKKEAFANYQLAVEAAGGRAVFSGDAGDLAQCVGMLLPGGGDVMPWRYGQENTFSRDLDGERDSMEFAFLKQAVSAGKPVLAICRGMQVVNVFFGGTLCQDLPGHSRLSGGIDRLHYARTAPSFLTPLYGAAQIINSAHHQAAACLGNGLRAVQWAPDGTVEALEHTSMPIYAVQWHPERMRGPFATCGATAGDRLFRAFLNRCAQKK